MIFTAEYIQSHGVHVKNDYVRMTRRPLDGQAMLQFPERLADLFSVEEVMRFQGKTG